MKAIEEKTRKVREEEQVWDLKIMLIFNNLRFAEIMKAKINQLDHNQQTILIETFLKNKHAGRVKLTLNMISKYDLRPVKWLSLWMVGKTQYQEGEIWKRKGIKQKFNAEQWNKKIREEMVNVGISKKERVTSIRAAYVTRTFQLGASSDQINRWTRQVNTASMVQQYND
ncbi:MAG: hypothetical protein EZS28_038672 [Streblomastix strix]|uniref:Tyr recombinase domain-containing protein n=1 Tax=Streblomastix strix TaxID=222440 RepID=A0A5J4U7F4_9EUKA|nr:MAG: hypothetical protein EZS28_038672 [Streblomastix strix]